MNETIELLLKRKSCRAFKREEVKPEIVAKLKELTMRAPTAGNMLLYSVIDVQDEKIKAKLAETCDGQGMIKNAPLVWIFLADNHKWEEFYRSSNSAEKFNTPLRTSGPGDFHLCMQDAIIAAHQACIAAESLGLASCYIGDIIENYEIVRDLLNLPAHAAPAAMLIIGESLSKNKETISVRPPIDSNIFMCDRYEEITKDNIEYQYSNHKEYYKNKKLLPYDNTGEVADYYYNRKYSSDFMEEMNRSAETFINRWNNEN